MTMFAAFVAAALLSTAPPDEGAPGDVARIRAHLERVERDLRAADVSALDAGPRAERAHLLDVLHAYRERGLFPHNHVLGYRNPVFIDPHGTPCAVGHLIIESGAREVALEISRTQNLAYVKDLTHPKVAPWAKAHGFTLDELARIQPSYDCKYEERCIAPRDATETRAVVRLTAQAGPALEDGLELPLGVTVVAAAQAHDTSGAWVLLSNGDILNRDASRRWTPRLKVAGATGLAVQDAQHVVVLSSERGFSVRDATTGERLLLDPDRPAEALAVLAAARGELWVTSPTGTFRKRVAKPWQRMGEGGVALAGAAGDVWVTTVDGGAWHFDGAQASDVSLKGRRLEALVALGGGRAAALSSGWVLRWEPGEGWGQALAIPSRAEDERALVTQAEQLTRGPAGELLFITGDGALLRDDGQLSALQLPTARPIHAALATEGETLLFVQSADGACDRYEHPCTGCESPGSCRGGVLLDDVRRPSLPCSAAGSAWSWAAVVAAALFTALHRRRIAAAP